MTASAASQVTVTASAASQVTVTVLAAGQPQRPHQLLQVSHSSDHISCRSVSHSDSATTPADEQRHDDSRAIQRQSVTSQAATVAAASILEGFHSICRCAIDSVNAAEISP